MNDIFNQHALLTRGERMVIRRAPFYNYTHNSRQCDFISMVFISESAVCNNEDAYEGIRCPGTDIHDGMCASWDEICDGVQKCGLRKKDLCIENLLRETSLSRRAAEDQCSGEESKNACDIRAKEPPSKCIRRENIRKPKIYGRRPGYSGHFNFWHSCMT